jgi:hypothetical protein
VVIVAKLQIIVLTFAVNVHNCEYCEESGDDNHRVLVVFILFHVVRNKNDKSDCLFAGYKKFVKNMPEQRVYPTGFIRFFGYYAFECINFNVSFLC